MMRHSPNNETLRLPNYDDDDGDGSGSDGDAGVTPGMCTTSTVYYIRVTGIT